MKRKRRIFGVLLIITALILMQLPVSEADAATSASDFRMEGTTLVKYRGTEESVSVPDTVEVIAEGAFEGNSYVELVVLPKSVKKIEPYAFWGCENLETVVLNTGMTEVGDYAFANCKGLTKMFLPDNIRRIGIQSFMDCVNLSDITIPAQVTNIHETSFDGCIRLTIHCEKGSYADQYAEMFYERQKEMPEYEDIENYLPGDTGSDSDDIQMPGTEDTGEVLGDTKVVGNQAVVFIDNTSLEVLDGKGTDSGLLKGDLLVGGGNLGRDEPAKYTIVDGKIIADQAYYRNEQMQELIIPEGIVEIGQFSFARSKIQEVTIPDGVRVISYGAFYHCDELRDIELPDSVEVVEPMAFVHTAWVDDFMKSGDSDYLISGGVLVAYKGQKAVVSIPEGVRVIAANVFAGHTEIEQLVLPKSLKVVGEAAFENCTGLSAVVLGEQLEAIKDRAFWGCNIHNVTLPQTVKTLGINAFDKKVQLIYAGAIPQMSHELTAERLSNEAYRNVFGQAQEGSVIVTGTAAVTASLEGATRNYSLSVTEVSDRSSMETAFYRCFAEEFPETGVVYQLRFTDESEIPITKLGRQLLQINIPLSVDWSSQKLTVYSLDRNGQLELEEAKRVRIDGSEYLRVELDYVSQIAVIGTEKASDEIPVLEETTTIKKMTQGPVAGAEKTAGWQKIFSAVLMALGAFCLLWRKRI